MCVNASPVKIETLLLIIAFPFVALFLKDFFASVAQRATKAENNRTSGEGTCFDLGT